jgi:hypothetical protein
VCTFGVKLKRNMGYRVADGSRAVEQRFKGVKDSVLENNSWRY